VRCPWPVVAAVSLALTGPAAAQDCYPAPGSNEAEIFAILSVPLAFSAAGPVGALPQGAVRGGLEIAAIPAIDSKTATPLTCRPGKGPENTNLLPVLPRPRVSVGLPGGFEFEASWIPPLRLRQTKANLFGIALGRRFPVRRSVALTVRGHATLGTVRGPFTCPDAALADSTSECFGGQRSDDGYQPNIVGADVAAAWVAGRRLHLFLGGGYNVLRPRFQVNFINSVGDTDNRQVFVNLSRAVVFGGVTWSANARTSVSGEAYVAPKDALTVRLTVRLAAAAGPSGRSGRRLMAVPSRSRPLTLSPQP